MYSVKKVRLIGNNIEDDGFQLFESIKGEKEMIAYVSYRKDETTGEVIFNSFLDINKDSDYLKAELVDNFSSKDVEGIEMISYIIESLILNK